MSTPANVTITPAAGSTPGVCLITFQVVDSGVAPIAAVFKMTVWLSDSSAGIGVTATAPAGGRTLAGGAGVILQEKVSQVAFDVVTDASGKFVLMVTDQTHTAWFPTASVPQLDTVVAGAALVGGNFA